MIVVFGAGFVVVGALTMWGGISGTMPAMIAAIFAPDLLTSAKPSSSTSSATGKDAVAVASTAAKSAVSAAGSVAKKEGSSLGKALSSIGNTITVIP